MLRGRVERSIGVYGEELLLWICAVRQSPRRPPADQLLQQANSLMNELKSSKASDALPVVSADDGQFAIAALIDEIAMSLPDLRPLWSQYSLQATRWHTTNAGVEFYQRLDRAKEGPRNVLATYYVVLGLGFMGRFGLPGQVQYGATQTRIDVARLLGRVASALPRGAAPAAITDKPSRCPRCRALRWSPDRCARCDA